MADFIGSQLSQPDPRGWLVFTDLPDGLRNAEDATQMADQSVADVTGRSRHTRSATAAERTLLEHLGYVLPAELRTHVTYLTDHVRRRHWPALETQTPSPSIISASALPIVLPEQLTH